jgi:hypothetical protein
MWCRLNVVVPPAAGGIPPDLLNKGAWCITWTDVVLTFCINSTREPRASTRCEDALYSATTLVLRASGRSTRCQGTSSGARCRFYVMIVSAREICFMRMDALKSTCPPLRMLNISHFSLSCCSPHAVPQAAKLQLKLRTKFPMWSSRRSALALGMSCRGPVGGR